MLLHFYTLLKLLPSRSLGGSLTDGRGHFTLDSLGILLATRPLDSLGRSAVVEQLALNASAARLVVIKRCGEFLPRRFAAWAMLRVPHAQQVAAANVDPGRGACAIIGRSFACSGSLPLRAPFSSYFYSLREVLAHRCLEPCPAFFCMSVRVRLCFRCVTCLAPIGVSVHLKFNSTTYVNPARRPLQSIRHEDVLQLPPYLSVVKKANCYCLGVVFGAVFSHSQVRVRTLSAVPPSPE